MMLRLLLLMMALSYREYGWHCLNWYGAWGTRDREECLGRSARRGEIFYLHMHYRLVVEGE